MRAARTFALTVRNTRAGRNVFLAVKPQSGVRDAAYTLTLSVR